MWAPDVLADRVLSWRDQFWPILSFDVLQNIVSNCICDSQCSSLISIISSVPLRWSMSILAINSQARAKTWLPQCRCATVKFHNIQPHRIPNISHINHKRPYMESSRSSIVGVKRRLGTRSLVKKDIIRARMHMKRTLRTRMLVSIGLSSNCTS